MFAVLEDLDEVQQSKTSIGQTVRLSCPKGQDRMTLKFLPCLVERQGKDTSCSQSRTGGYQNFSPVLPSARWD